MLRREIPAALVAGIGTVILIALIYFGSRRFQDFDSALIGYAVATVIATAAILYKYTLWITRPPTWRYFKAGWQNFFSFANFRRYTALIPVSLWRDIFGQTFIRKRGFGRWFAHMCIFWGVLLSLAVTLPLTFGWVRFTLIEPGQYQLWMSGIPVFQFPVEAGTGFALFHALNFTGALLIVGVAMALWRRVVNLGMLTTQRFGFDLMPLVLLFAIAITGMALTASTMWWDGAFYWFISLVHQVVVVAWLLSIPFGKFFHIVQRPASVGVRLYQVVNQNIEGSEANSQPLRCRRCERDLPSAQFIADLKANLRELGQSYELGEGLGALQDYCPTCKRLLRGTAYYQLLGKRFL